MNIPNELFYIILLHSDLDDILKFPLVCQEIHQRMKNNKSIQTLIKSRINQLKKFLEDWTQECHYEKQGEYFEEVWYNYTLCYACGYGRLDIVDLLFRYFKVDPEEGTTDSNNPLSLASESGHVEVVDRLLKEGLIP